MDQAINDPSFIKSALRCYRMKKHARHQVRQNKIFYRQLVKVYGWREEIRQQLSKQADQQQQQQPEYSNQQQYEQLPPIKKEEKEEEEESKPMIKIEPEISHSQESQQHNQHDRQQFNPNLAQQNRLQNLIETPPPPPLSSSSTASSMSFSDNQATVMSASSGSAFYTPPTSAGGASICGIGSTNIGGGGGSSGMSGNSNSSNSGSSCSSSSLCHITATIVNSYNSSESAGSCSNHSYEVSCSPPARGTPNSSRKSSKRQNNSKLNVEELRHKLWLKMVIKEIPQAQKRKASLREQKLIKTKSIAHSCVNHLEAFHKRNARPQVEAETEDEEYEVEDDAVAEEDKHETFMLELYPEQILSFE